MEDAVELTTFTAVGDGYVYAPLPPATSYGHRAETWNPDKWMQEVKIKVVTAGDNCFVRMLAKDSGELFAECPLPADGTSLTTAVEQVVDSSRYFVVRIVDRESRKHAFVGIGFRDRLDASDFTAALDDYRQYLRRKREAEQLRQDFDTLQPPSSSEGAGDGGAEAAATGQKDFSLKPGETIHIKLSPSLKRGDSGKAAASAAGSTQRAGSGGSSSSNAAAAPGSVPRLAPPSSSSSSSSGFFRVQLSPPGASSSVSAGALGSDSQQLQQQSESADLRGEVAAAQQLPGPGRASLDGSSEQPAVDVAEDDWGDFVG